VCGVGGGGGPKCSRRDLAHAVARGLNGSTTVAATMLIARMAGIAVFVTGGIAQGVPSALWWAHRLPCAPPLLLV